MKKILALVVAMLLVLGMTSAFAATINISRNGTNIDNAHTYEAYQIFDGTLNESGVLSDIVWGTGVNGSALLAALQADTTIGAEFADAATAEDVAKAMKDFNAEQMVAFSRVFEGEGILTSAKTTGTDSITGLDDGYYFVKDTTAVGNGDALSAYVVQLVGTANIAIKTDAPEIEKKVKNHNELIDAYRDANNVGIGDTVDYQITSKVPNMANYKKYYYIVHDTLSKGLTYDPATLVIKVGNKTLEENNDYTVTATNVADKTQDTEIEIVFKNFIQYQASQPGADIEITYSATLNDAAEVGVNGNPNEVELEYSNNPNKEGEGEDKPGSDDDDVTGKTPKDTVITYTTNLKILKVDENREPLDSVTFAIKGYAENKKVTYTEEFEVAEDGEYYKLADGTYTKEPSNALTIGKYANDGKKYNLVVKAGVETLPVTYVEKTATTGNDGIIDIGALIANGSLPAGTYVIHETATKTGYNKLDNDIIVTVTNEITANVKDVDFENPAKNTKITWKVSGSGASNATVKNDGTIEIKIENRSGTTLPSTGGIGTTIFYVGGGILVLAAVILLVTKRRMSSED